MHTPETQERLRWMHSLFGQEIDRQANEQVRRSCQRRCESLTEALRAFGSEPVVATEMVEVWEDSQGLLPPKIIAELIVFIHGGELRQRFEVPVGPLHRPHRPERLFELCMLRAEADHELHGQGDGQALERMAALAQELHLNTQAR